MCDKCFGKFYHPFLFSLKKFMEAFKFILFYFSEWVFIKLYLKLGEKIICKCHRIYYFQNKAYIVS